MEDCLTRVRLALWIPCLLAAAGAHVLAGALAIGGRSSTPAQSGDEEWHFLLRRTASDAWHDGVTDVFFVPHQELELFTSRVSCRFWKETVDGVEVSKSSCHFSISDGFDVRARLEREVAGEHLTHPWAGSFFRGFEYGSGPRPTRP